ncbi:MAG: hypothetical protein ACRC62_20340 [Microcoleus sp.]
MAVVIGSVVFTGLACGQSKKAEPGQLQTAIEQRNQELKKYGY